MSKLVCILVRARLVCCTCTVLAESVSTTRTFEPAMTVVRLRLAKCPFPCLLYYLWSGAFYMHILIWHLQRKGPVRDLVSLSHHDRVCDYYNHKLLSFPTIEHVACCMLETIRQQGTARDKSLYPSKCISALQHKLASPTAMTS